MEVFDFVDNRMMEAITINSYRKNFGQRVGDVSFLWYLRSVALDQPHYSTSDIANLEERIEIKLDGLFNYPDDVWPICSRTLEAGDPGEIFTAAIVAFRSLDVRKIQAVVESAMVQEATTDCLVSALCWLPDNISQPWLEKFLRSKDLDHKYLAVCTLSALRRDPGEYLAETLRRNDCIAHSKLYARCLRLIGELKRVDLEPVLFSTLKSNDVSARFWSMWSLALLGNRGIVSRLEPFVLEPGEYQDKATEVYFRVAPKDRARQVISQLAKGAENTNTVIKAARILGDTKVIPWLITIMENPKHSRTAAEAFSHITGIELEEYNLSLDVPELPEVLSEDIGGDTNVELSYDEYLPWPDIEKLKAVWQKYGNQYPASTRLFLGKTISIERLSEYCDKGLQRVRHAAALELALSDKTRILLNTRAKIIDSH